MKSLRLLALLSISLFTVSACFTFASPAYAVRGGTVAEAGQMPAFAGLFKAENDGGYDCGGVLVASDRVLTAAHCVDDKNPKYISVGDRSIAQLKSWSDQNPYGITGIVHLPNYKILNEGNQQTVQDDMAVLRLERPVEGVSVAQISDTPMKVGAIYQAFGHGVTQGDSPALSDPLKTLKLRNIDSTTCSAKMLQKIPGGMECFQPERVASQDSACSGDSGGPLVDAKGNVVAVASWVNATEEEPYCADPLNPVQAFQDVVQYKQMILDPHLFDLIPTTINSRVPVTTVIADSSLSKPIVCRLANGEVPERWKVSISGGDPRGAWIGKGNKKDNPDGKISISADIIPKLKPADSGRCDVLQTQVPGAPTGYKTVSSVGFVKYF
ncbi:S1 family peptidase [Psychromicrobium sp. YIM B11713]|uniref:S1 family peptidase n=1 Tax=Psychromicrobium sp. YIM B11713 TaxID=3145233 RepID=UPI00374ED730